MHSSVDKGLKDTKYRLDLAMSNAGSTKYKLDPIFKGTTTFLKKNSFYRPRKDERLSRPWSHRYNKHTYSTLKNIFQKEETGWQ